MKKLVRSSALLLLAYAGCAAFAACSVNDLAGLGADAGSAEDATTDSADTDATSAGDSGADTGSDASTHSDASTDGDSGADAGFSVSSVVGLVLWLDANKGVTENAGQVVAWADQSSSHNDAVAPVADAGDGGDSSNPYKLAGVANGFPAIRFGLSPFDTDAGPITDGGPHTPVTSYVTVPDSPSLAFETGDFLIETVIRVEHSAFGAVFEKQLTTDPYAGVGLFTNFGTATYGAQIDGYHTVIGTLMSDLGTWRVYGLTRHGSTLAVRIDGAVQTQVDFNADGGDDAAAAVDCSAVGRDLTIGAQVKGVATLFDLGADLAEMIAVKGPITPAGLATLEHYLKTKYAIP